MANRLFTGEKVKLRAYRKEDVELALKYINDPEVKRYLTPGIPYPLTLEDEYKWFESLSSSKDTYSFAIETLEDGKYIGGCGINEIDWKNKVAVVGIFIGDKEYWGKGYGTDAMKVLIRFIFEQMNMNRVELYVYSYNTRAIKSYEKCGFVKEGVLRKRMFRDGRYYDEYVMSILKEEFDEKYRRR
ncbi:acetyltransferase [Caldanaerobacter subterraneus subsp. pacificus DSM 12653]|uniref:Acetyltransferase n=1 Tax=Caldanaerobacter subterraneus subsp. pacificus DSM 12653 TaxID=391606 RepID=A0A0F5PRN4_9THEO|nr:GNAT family protein [Caldanaerobacter subterraneus]KKC30494.1 acetyltransferase [Caldanaerobacter subterraneus subsp. pacificus DSM 12653]